MTNSQIRFFRFLVSFFIFIWFFSFQAPLVIAIERAAVIPQTEKSPSFRISESEKGKNKSDQMKKDNSQLAEYHFSLAQGYSSDGELDKAIEEYRLCLMYDPHSAILYARLSAEYVKKGMLSAAMESSKQALQQDPNYLDAHLILGGLYSATRDSQAALEEYDKALKIDPKLEEAVVYKAQVLIEDGKFTQAVSALHRFLKLNSDSALTFYYLARAEQQQKHFKEAIQGYRKAMELRPGFSQASLGLGLLYEEKNMIPQAIAIYRELYDSIQDLSAANRLATLYLKQEKYSQSVPYLEAVEASDPDDTNVRVKLGLVQMELKHFDQAIELFKKILQKNPESERIHYYLGSLYEEKKQFDLAISELKHINPTSKLYPESALHVALLLKQLKRTTEAKLYIASSIESEPKIPTFYIFQASLEEDEKQITKAIKILEKAAVDFPDDEKIHYYLGSLYDREGDIDRGIGQMETILKINPENVDAMNYIGYTWTQKGIRLNDVERLLKKALVLRPGNGYVQDSWGWYLLVKGQVTQAVLELEKAAKLKPSESTILEHLGDAYVRSNLKEKAIVQYLDAAKYAETEVEKNKILSKVDNLKRDATPQSTMSSQNSK